METFFIILGTNISDWRKQKNLNKQVSPEAEYYKDRTLLSKCQQNFIHWRSG